MLKSRAGEATALEHLTAATKQLVMPVFHTTTTVAPTFAQKLSLGWGTGRVAVDGAFSFNETNSVQNFNSLIRGLRSLNVDAIPSIALSSDPRLIQAAVSHVNASGIVVRCQVDEMPLVPHFLNQHQINQQSTDLFIVVGHVSGMPINALAQAVAAMLLQHIGPQNLYRSVTVAAAAAPKDHGDLPRGRNVVPRHDMRLFTQIQALINFGVDYADYAIGHPDLSEPPGYAMARATVSARYADQNNWIIIKGRSTGGQSGIPMATQYTSHAAALIGEPTFGQVANCWADKEIHRIASGNRRSGNRTTWAGLGINRHIEVTVDQL